MKLNFGHGIAMVLILFVGTFVWLGIKAFSQTFELKTENYYDADQKFPTILKSLQNAADRGWMAFPAHKNDHAICWQMPTIGKPQRVKLTLYRPSSQKLDRTFELDSDPNGRLCLDSVQMAAGYYDVIFEWMEGEMMYRVEQKLINS